MDSSEGASHRSSILCAPFIHSRIFLISPINPIWEYIRGAPYCSPRAIRHNASTVVGAVLLPRTQPHSRTVRRQALNSTAAATALHRKAAHSPLNSR
eukprot:2716600-Pleurochrysis_carterae.AAC.1